MHSHRTLLVACLIVAAVALAAGLWLRGDNDELPEASPTPTASAMAATPTPARTMAPAPRAHTVRLTASGVSPKALTIRAGDSVTFSNDSGPDFWVASDPHPSHGLCAGFDARRGLKQGDSYTLAFTTRATCSYHNHLDAANSSQRGTIIVE
jgi:plastocyanin